MTFSLKFIRKNDYNKKRKTLIENFGFDMGDWFKNPYSCLKARLYIEGASILVFIVQNTKVTPNFLSLTYAFLGAIGGIFLASNNQSLILISLILFFSNGLFDWADGLLARLTKQTSELGELLDNWGAQVGTYSFLCGFGIYLYHKNGEEYFAALAIIIVLIKSLDLKNYAYENTMHKIFHSKTKTIIKNINHTKKKDKDKFGLSNNFYFIRNFIVNFLDNRSRTTDFICLLIFIDTFYINVVLLNYIYYLIFLRVFVLFCGGFYITYFKNFLGKLK